MLIEINNFITHIENVNDGKRIYNRPNGDNNIHIEIFKSVAREIDLQLFDPIASTKVDTDAGSRYTIWFAGANWYAYVV